MGGLPVEEVSTKEEIGLGEVVCSTCECTLHAWQDMYAVLFVLDMRKASILPHSLDISNLMLFLQVSRLDIDCKCAHLPRQ